MKKNHTLLTTALLLLGLSTVQIQAQNLDLLKQAVKGASITHAQKTGVKNLYQVLVDGQLMYVSEDGQYAVYGTVIDLKNRQNITDQTKAALRAEILAAVPTSEMIIFKPTHTQHVVTVFTDPDCQWCRKLHSDLERYLQAGIEIRSLAYPRTGSTDASAQKLASIWCSSHRAAAFNAAMQGTTLSPGTCSNPVSRHYELGERFGVTGTPSLILSDGRLLPGYVSAEELVQILNP